jgi:polysaccharide export outer membrane protein
MPPHVIEPPDLLLINAVRLVPLPPYRIEPLDILSVHVSGALPKDEPAVANFFAVEPDGTINLGPNFGAVRVAGLTLDEARAAIEKHFRGIFKTPREVFVAVVESRGLQQIAGEHLVRPDGTVSLGTYGRVYVAGMTVEEARRAIELHLSRYVLRPEIALEVLAYNSKVYYIIFDGGGFGQQVIQLPVTGNDTVLDAIAKVGGLPGNASKHHMWVARPAPAGLCCDHTMAVDWEAITKCGDPTTNYQLLPGDRIYVKADPMIAFDNFVAKVTAPFERMFGFTLLGHATVRDLQQGGEGRIGGFGGF